MQPQGRGAHSPDTSGGAGRVNGRPAPSSQSLDTETGWLGPPAKDPKAGEGSRSEPRILLRGASGSGVGDREFHFLPSALLFTYPKLPLRA